MIVPFKLLTDSRLTAFFIFDSNKNAPKRHKKGRISAAIGLLQGLHYTSSIFLPNASATRDSTSMLVA